MSKEALDSDIYNGTLSCNYCYFRVQPFNDLDLYGEDDVEIQVNPEDGQNAADEDFIEPTSAPASPVDETKDKTLPLTQGDTAHALPPKPSSQNSMSYSAQIAQQFSAYQQTPSQERQQRNHHSLNSNSAIKVLVGGSTVSEDAAGTVYGKKPSEMHDHG
jgi:RNA-binding protein Musashi